MEAVHAREPFDVPRRDLALWVPVGLIPIVDGILRMMLYEPQLGARTAGYVSAAVDIIAILAFAAWAEHTERPLRRGLIWLTLSTALHFALGRALGLPLSTSLAKYDLSMGEPWGLVSAFIFASPLIVNAVGYRARMRRARVLLLVGPKGSGKSTIGRALADGKRIRFVEVEAIARAVLAERGNVIDERYARAAFEAILEELAGLERAHEVLVVETTGASEESNDFLEELRARYRVLLVRIRAEENLCTARICARDPAAQIAVHGDLVKEMHRRTLALAWPWSLTVENDGSKEPAMLAEEIRRAL